MKKILILAGGYSKEREISLDTARSVYSELLKDNKYLPEEEDRVVLSVKLKAFENDNKIFDSSYFLDEKGSGENTAMGKLVSITLSAAIDLILDNKIETGVKTAPHDNENIQYFFKILKENNINIQQHND